MVQREMDFSSSHLITKKPSSLSDLRRGFSPGFHAIRYWDLYHGVDELETIRLVWTNRTHEGASIERRASFCSARLFSLGFQAGLACFLPAFIICNRLRL